MERTLFDTPNEVMIKHVELKESFWLEETNQ